MNRRHARNAARQAEITRWRSRNRFVNRARLRLEHSQFDQWLNRNSLELSSAQKRSWAAIVRLGASAKIADCSSRLGIAGRAVECQQVEPVRERGIGELGVLEHPRQSTAFLDELAIQQVAVHQMKCLAQVGVARALAFAGDRSQRPAECIQEERCVVGVGQRDRAGAGGKLRELLDRAGRRVDAVKQLLGRQPLDRVMGEERRIQRFSGVGSALNW